MSEILRQATEVVIAAERKHLEKELDRKCKQLARRSLILEEAEKTAKSCRCRHHINMFNRRRQEYKETAKEYLLILTELKWQKWWR